MKTFYFFIIILLSAIQIFAQSNNQTPKLSASANLFLWKQKNNNSTTAVFPENVYRLDANQNIFISTMILVQSDFNETALSNIGALVGTKAGNIWTVQVPVNQMNSFIQINGIEYIDMDQPLSINLDAARTTTKVDSVQNGYGLPQAYSGKDVVVGIIDAGFDYTHPTFYDTSYS
ncbi:MAG: hypothetical protein WCJ33_09550, partial [Pseudomonadota bacterium]